jgi:hypothetical protein
VRRSATGLWACLPLGDPPRLALASLAQAAITLAGCVGPASSVDAVRTHSPTAACPRDAERASSGRCACAEGTFSLLGACVPAVVGDAFCGRGARVGESGCAFRPCSAAEVLDVASGVCLAAVVAQTLARGLAPCGDGLVAIMEDGRVVCAPPDAACPRGARLVGRTCAPGLHCPPGTLADGRGCRPIVFAGGPTSPGDDSAPTRVDMGTFLALAVGIDGGLGSPELCRPLIQRPALFGASSGRSQGLRLRLTFIAPDQDLTRLRVDARPWADGVFASSEISAAAQGAIMDAVSTLSEPLRGFGGESSVTAAQIDVRCTLGAPER